MNDLRVNKICSTEKEMATLKGNNTGMAAPTFKNIPIDPDCVEACLQAIGITDLTVTPKTEKHRVFAGTVDGERFALNLFVNNDGKCTLGRTAGLPDAAFVKVASQIFAQCKYGAGHRLELSVQIPPEHPDLIVEFLCSQGGKVIESQDTNIFKLWRLQGPRGDTLVLKAFKNRTLQAQGTHAQVATWLFDYLGNVLGLDEILEQQRKLYDIPLTTQEVKDELKARIPAVHDYLAEPVRKQFSSAHALSKVGIPLEDFAALAFPALRGIEGFCFQVLEKECKFDPAAKAQLGDYFESIGGGYRMRSPHRDGLNPSLQTLLDGTYALWHKHRHGLFHMDGTVETTRVLATREAAVTITTEVLSFVDKAYEQYANSKT